MAKSVIKEIFIMLLLCIAIALVLGILFYNDIPINRVIPTKEAYITPENVKEEIDEQITEVEKTEISYEITDSDLNIYKQSSSYKPGKRDPFSEIKTGETGINNNTNTDNQDETKNENGQTKEDADKNSTNTFFDNEGSIK